MGKVTGGAKFYFVTSPAGRKPVVGDLVDFSECIVGGDFSMGELSLHDKVKAFLRDALGLHPAEVKGLLLDEGVISVECYAYTFTGRRAHDESGDAITYFKTYTL